MLEKILIIALMVQAIHYTMQEGEVFGKLGQWFYNHLPHAIHQPVFDCPVCMTPWYGTVIYWLVFAPMTIYSLSPLDVWVSTHAWIDWLVIVIAAMGLNAVINKITAAFDDGDDDDYYEEDVPEQEPGKVKNIAA